MPILAPDRNKKKIGGVVFEQMRPSFAGAMRAGSENNLQRMAAASELQEETNEEYEANGAMALSAMWSAMQSGDLKAAYHAYKTLHLICDDQLDSEGDMG